MKPRIPDSVRKEVQTKIKNNIDIGSLITPYSISGEDFAGAVIKEFNRVEEDLSNLNLANAIIGEEGKETHISRSNMKGCCFKGTKFLGKVIAKKTDFRNTDFSGAYIPYCDYRLADMRGCTFCGTIFTIQTGYSLGAKFDVAFFKDLAKHWDVQVIPRAEYEKLLSNQKEVTI